jgi:hypothetical protein
MNDNLELYADENTVDGELWLDVWGEQLPDGASADCCNGCASSLSSYLSCIGSISSVSSRCA